MAQSFQILKVQNVTFKTLRIGEKKLSIFLRFLENYVETYWRHLFKFQRSKMWPPVNHAYPRAFDARVSFVNDARIPAQDFFALNAHLTRARHL